MGGLNIHPLIKYIMNKADKKLNKIGSSESKRKTPTQIISLICATIFLAGIFLCIISFGMSINSNENYEQALPEINTTSSIDTIKIDYSNDRLYVCYANASCVNTYSLDGDFLWAVSIPSHQNGSPDFYLENNKLIIYWYDAYIYDAITGEFVEFVEDERFDDLEYPYYEDSVRQSPEACGYYYDLTDVYTYDGNGTIKYIVEKPIYYLLLQPIVGFLISFISIIAIGIIVAIGEIRKIKKSNFNSVVTSSKAKIYIKYLKFLFTITILYSILNIILPIINTDFMVFNMAIIPIVVIFIITGWLYKLITHKFSNEEKGVCSKWFMYCIFAIGLSFVSEILMCLIFD
jgi:hypothetical protein